MSFEINKLLKYAQLFDPSLAQEIALKIYSSIGFEHEILNDEIEIDLWEMESLINGKKFDFPKEKLEDVSVEIDK